MLTCGGDQGLGGRQRLRQARLQRREAGLHVLPHRLLSDLRTPAQYSLWRSVSADAHLRLAWHVLALFSLRKQPAKKCHNREPVMPIPSGFAFSGAPKDR